VEELGEDFQSLGSEILHFVIKRRLAG